MSQFYVYLNANTATRKNIPYLLDVQTDLLNQMDSRVVVPLKRVTQASILLQHLNPVFEIEGDLYAMLTADLVGVSSHILGKKVVSLEDQRDKIIAALDFLIFGF